MAESWTIIANKQVAGTQFGGGKTTISKAEGEEMSQTKITHATKTLKPLEEAKILTIEAESETEAALAAGYLYGFSDQGLGTGTGPKVQLVKTSSLGEKASR